MKNPDSENESSIFVPGSTEVDPAGDLFIWDSQFETGLPEIDRQHQRLMQFINTLNRTLVLETESESFTNSLLQALDNLSGYADYHFKTEEELMQRYIHDHETEQAHKLAHAEFSRTIAEARIAARDRPFEVAGQLLTFQSQWLLTHIAGIDAQMAKAIQATKSGVTAREAMHQTGLSIKEVAGVSLRALSRLYAGLAARTDALLNTKRNLDRQVELHRIVERELRQQKQFSDDIINNLPGIFYMLDAQGRFVRNSPNFLKVTGYTEQEVLQMTALDFFEGEDRSLIAQKMEAAFRTGEAVAEAEVVTRDGQKIAYHFTGHRTIINGQPFLVGVGWDITSRLTLERELVLQARTDPLTGLYNRRHFLELAEQELSRAKRYEKPLSMLMIDLDEFKAINDSNGHQTGDNVLRKIAEICRLTLREVDIIGRMGGEEFAILLPESDAAQAMEVAERLRLRIADATIPLEQQGELSCTASIGAATLDGADIDVDQLLNLADKGMYEAKRSGRNQVRAKSLH